ncbi:hypothetical protein [Diaminobutyricimonas aerilata]|uniref:hypothetical protein n=1 Tax=Diaminobutyricimonas aerilata TaxID=1162967 RepID=UPI0012FDE3A4|nr:hypothetical protein [Diaminobutyricimonas aerilata]
MVEVTQECRHGVVAAACASCWTPPTELPLIVYISASGRAFHASLNCPTERLTSERLGDVFPVHPVVSTQVQDRLAPCHACFP